MSLCMKPSVEELSKDIFAVVNSTEDTVYGGYGANQGFVLLENSVLVFDSGFSTVQARTLLDSVRSVTVKPIGFIVNSHDHSDHVFGNSFLLKEKSNIGRLPIVFSHDICKQKMQRNCEYRLQEYRARGSRLHELLEGLQIVLPDVTFPDNSVRMEIEGKQLCFIHPETGAHTLGDTILAMPEEGVLFSGDVLWNDFYPNLEDANLEGWISFLEDFDLSTYRKYLPGHGEICGSEGLLRFLNYLKKVRQNLFETKGNESPEEKRNCFLFPETEKWRMSFIIETNIDSLFGNARNTLAFPASVS